MRVTPGWLDVNGQSCVPAECRAIVCNEAHPSEPARVPVRPIGVASVPVIPYSVDSLTQFFPAALAV